MVNISKNLHPSRGLHVSGSIRPPLGTTAILRKNLESAKKTGAYLPD